MNEKTYKKNLEIIEKESDDKLLLFNVNSGKMMELNITGKLLWEKTQESFNFEDLKRIIDTNCILDKESKKNIEFDLREFINGSIEKKIILENGRKEN